MMHHDDLPQRRHSLWHRWLRGRSTEAAEMQLVRACTVLAVAWAAVGALAVGMTVLESAWTLLRNVWGWLITLL